MLLIAQTIGPARAKANNRNRLGAPSWRSMLEDSLDAGARQIAAAASRAQKCYRRRPPGALAGTISLERFVIVRRGLFLQRADVSTAQVLFRGWLPAPLGRQHRLAKLSDASEHGVSP
jgi:hypothetical protein